MALVVVGPTDKVVSIWLMTLSFAKPLALL